jgi:hypothetical protein
VHPARSPRLKDPARIPEESVADRPEGDLHHFRHLDILHAVDRRGFQRDSDKAAIRKVPVADDVTASFAWQASRACLVLAGKGIMDMIT